MWKWQRGPSNRSISITILTDKVLIRNFEGSDRIDMWQVSTVSLLCTKRNMKAISKSRFCFRDLQSITKKHIPLFFNLSFFLYISGTAWGTINLFTSSCILFWRAFSWNNNFSHLVTKSADICKNVNLPIKS